MSCYADYYYHTNFNRINAMNNFTKKENQVLKYSNLYFGTKMTKCRTFIDNHGN